MLPYLLYLLYFEDAIKDPNSRYITGIGGITHAEDDKKAWIYVYNSMVLLTLSLILLLAVLTIVAVVRRLYVDKTQDPEKLQLVQDRYKQVYN